MLRNLPARGFEEFLLQLMGELGKHPEIIRATTEATRKEHEEATKPFERKLREVEKELDGVSEEVARLIGMAKRPELKDLSSDFIEEANAAGRRKTELQDERQKIKMENGNVQFYKGPILPEHAAKRLKNALKTYTDAKDKGTPTLKAEQRDGNFEHLGRSAASNDW